MSDKNVSFICPGAQKSGTTTLFSMLIQHPSVYLHPEKELYFFDDDRNFKKGRNWYASLFSDSSDSQIIGDITPDYMLFPNCADRIFEYNKNVKLIFMLRNPADRAFSHYLMNRRTTEENESFVNAIKLEPKRMDGSYKKTMRYSYLERGYYYRQLKSFYEIFSSDNIKVLIFEEFIKDIPGEMKKLESFLGISAFTDYLSPERTNEGYLPQKQWIAYIKRHLVRPVRGIYNKVLPVKLRGWIRKATDAGALPKEILPVEMHKKLMLHFQEDIRSLEKLISRDLSIWE